MSKSVVTAAAAAAHAKRVEKGKKLAKQHEARPTAADEAQAAEQQQDAAKAVQTESELRHQVSMADSQSGGFSFAGALANAAASSAALTSEVSVQGGDGGSDGEGDGSGTILLIGALGLVGAGAAVLAGGGGGGNVPPPNAAPVGTTAAQTATEDTVKTFTVSATDANNDPLTYTLGTVVGGTAAISGTTVTYTPTANFNGAGSVVVNISDGKGGTTSQTVAITVAAVNDAPTLGTIAAQTTAEDTAVTFNAVGADVDTGTTLTYAVANAVGGAATVSSTGAVTFTPTANFNGAASVQVTVSDGTATSAAQTVAINVTPVNDVPVASANNTTTITTNEDTPKEFFIDFTDVDNATNTLTVQVTTAPTKGTFNAAGTHYVPNANANGTDSFTYVVKDPAGGTSAPVTVSVTITPVNDAPVLANIAAATTPFQTAVTFPVTATDVDSNTLTFSVSNPVGGTAAVNNGQVTFTPNAGFSGAGSVIVAVADGSGGTAQQTVAVTVGAGGPTTTTQSIDLGNLFSDASATVITLDAATAYNLTDSYGANTFVLIKNFNTNDSIRVSGVADLNNVSFGTNAGVAGGDNDLKISYEGSGGTRGQIVLEDAIVDPTVPFVFSFATAADALNNASFMTIA